MSYIIIAIHKKCTLITLLSNVINYPMMYHSKRYILDSNFLKEIQTIKYTDNERSKKERD